MIIVPNPQIIVRNKSNDEYKGDNISFGHSTEYKLGLITVSVCVISWVLLND